MKKTFLLFLILCNHCAYSNNVQISSITLSNQNVAGAYTFLTADLSWENSWRTSMGPANWDAIWLFAKYKKSNDSIWNHATLNTSGHMMPVGASTNTSADGKGTFVYRASNGSGNVSFPNIQIRWNYGIDGLNNTDSLEIKLFGIEMVYVPQGSFYVGDGASGADLYGNFELGTSGAPYQITSEGPITLGGGSANSLGNNMGVNQLQSGDDFDDNISQNLSGNYPKGFNAYYIMKYEMTQQQFVDMVNLSSATQRATLLLNNFFIGGLATAQSRRYGISQTYPHTTTEVYTPMIYLDWIRAAAYADWSALRPMSEFEFEKACRGQGASIVNEYAWGNSNVDLTNDLVLNNLTLEDEGITSGYNSGGAIGNCWIRAGAKVMTTVARVGIFAAHPANSGRVSSGASFYGCMELSGNCWERVVSVGSTEGRKFLGVHGDGILHPAGYANVSNWPGTYGGSNVLSNVGMGYRGGGLSFPTPNLERNARVSSRVVSSSFYNQVIEDDGARFVRTAP